MVDTITEILERPSLLRKLDMSTSVHHLYAVAQGSYCFLLLSEPGIEDIAQHLYAMQGIFQSCESVPTVEFRGRWTPLETEVADLETLSFRKWPSSSITEILDRASLLHKPDISSSVHHLYAVSQAFYCFLLRTELVIRDIALHLYAKQRIFQSCGSLPTVVFRGRQTLWQTEVADLDMISFLKQPSSQITEILDRVFLLGKMDISSSVHHLYAVAQGYYCFPLLNEPAIEDIELHPYAMQLILQSCESVPKVVFRGRWSPLEREVADLETLSFRISPSSSITEILDRASLLRKLDISTTCTTCTLSHKLPTVSRS